MTWWNVVLHAPAGTSFYRSLENKVLIQRRRDVDAVFAGILSPQHHFPITRCPNAL